MDKEMLRIMISVMVVFGYLGSLLAMVLYDSTDILIVNIGTWLGVILIFNIIAFVEWLNRK